MPHYNTSYSFGEKFLLDIQTIFMKGTKKLSFKEKEFLKGWLSKMLLRSSKNDIEGNYRYYWMLKESLEIYFELRGQWYLGQKKSFRWLKENDNFAFSLFENSYQKDSSYKDIEKLVSFLKNI